MDEINCINYKRVLMGMCINIKSQIFSQCFHLVYISIELNILLDIDSIQHLTDL